MFQSNPLLDVFFLLIQLFSISKSLSKSPKDLIFFISSFENFQKVFQPIIWNFKKIKNIIYLIFYVLNVQKIKYQIYQIIFHLLLNWFSQDNKIYQYHTEQDLIENVETEIHL